MSAFETIKRADLKAAEDRRTWGGQSIVKGQAEPPDRPRTNTGGTKVASAAPRGINRLILHCSATGPSLDIGGYEIRKWHVEDNGWSDIGYHGIIRRDGSLELGRDWRRQGAHVYGENGDSLGLCLVGGRAASADDHFTDHFTPEQLTALVPLIQTALTFGLSVHGHNEFANKGCPGFRVDGFIQEFVA